MCVCVGGVGGVGGDCVYTDVAVCAFVCVLQVGELVTVFVKMEDSGICRDKNNQSPRGYGKHGAKDNSAWCRQQCTSLDACVAYDHSTSNGYCQLYGNNLPPASKPPTWGVGSGNGGTDVITRADTSRGHHQTTCYTKDQRSRGATTTAVPKVRACAHSVLHSVCSWLTHERGPWRSRCAILSRGRCVWGCASSPSSQTQSAAAATPPPTPRNLEPTCRNQMER